ncbi:MAG: hypothetical protein ABSF48_10600 [Thermodesulfobacteriota bacterium]|jgi:hypothetical protein
MGSKFSFSIPLKNIKEYARKVVELPPLPDYITKRGPYIHEAAKIMVIYEFDKAKIADAWEIIWKHLDAFRGIPGFTLSAPILREVQEVKGSRINPEKQEMPKPFLQNSQTFE